MSERTAAGEPDDISCPFGSSRLQRAVCDLLRFDVSAARVLLSSAAHDAWPVVLAFIDGTVVYILSKEWVDLLSIYIFRLHPRPFCEGSGNECGHEAPAWQLGLFAIGLLVTLAPVQCLAAVLARRLPSLSIVPAMAAMAVGWSLGDASVGLVLAVDGRATSMAACESCNSLNLFLSLGATVVSALLTLVIDDILLQADAKGDTQAPRGAIFSAAIRLGQAGWALLTRGLKFNVMMLWSSTFKHAIVWGVAPSDTHTRLYGRTLVLYALVQTAAFSLFTVWSVRWRQWLEARALPIGPLRPAPLAAEDDADGLAEAATAAVAERPSASMAAPLVPAGPTNPARARVAPTSALDASRTLVQPLLAATDDGGSSGASHPRHAGSADSFAPSTEVAVAPLAEHATTQQLQAQQLQAQQLQAQQLQTQQLQAQQLQTQLSAAAELSTRQIGQALRRLTRRQATARILVLLEATMGWVSGCAWTDAIIFWSPLAAYPTGSVCLKDLGIALATTLFSISWLVVNSGSSAAVDDSSEVRREHVERYFITNALSYVTGWAWVGLLRDLSTLTAERIVPPRDRSEGWSSVGEALCVVLFGPVLTLLLVATKRTSFAAVVCGGSSPSGEPDSSPSISGGTGSPAGQALETSRTEGASLPDGQPSIGDESVGGTRPASRRAAERVAVEGGGERAAALIRALRAHRQAMPQGGDGEWRGRRPRDAEGAVCGSLTAIESLLRPCAVGAEGSSRVLGSSSAQVAD